MTRVPGPPRERARRAAAPVPSLGLGPVRAVRAALDGDLPPERAALLVAGDEHPAALVGAWAGGGALAASGPVRLAAGDEDPFALLDAQPALTGEVPDGFVGGGWIGVLGYRLGERLEHLPEPPPEPGDERLPSAPLAFYDHLLHCDPQGRWWFEALWTPGRAQALDDRRRELAARLAAGGRAPRPARARGWTADPTPGGHRAAVEACRERIRHGDLFQANLALRLRGRLDGEPADLFTAGAAALRPERAAWVQGPWGAVVSLSPELFLQRRGEEVLSAPIKGTRPRPDDPAAAEAERAALAASAKDRAENVMIVDLVRNDLGRVCDYGSVHVRALTQVRPHAGVWHLVSEVAGRRHPGISDARLLRALFPPGSVTGAPKIAAMQVISECESHARQSYCGAIGIAGPAIGLELNVAIRTFECRDGRIWLDVGGGIVADSDPDAEAAECLTKARPLLAAVGADTTIAEPPAAAAERRAPAIARLAAIPVPRADPAAGVFETLLVRGGEPVALDGHLERLRSSLADLYGAGLPPGLADDLTAAAGSLAGPHRLRVTVGPQADGGLAAAITHAPAPSGGAAPALGPVTLPGGLGVHKWADRRLIDALSAHVAPAVAVFVDLDGLVLEASRASVFAVSGDGTLWTPPLDGRILPGTTRARVLTAARRLGLDVREAPLPLAALDGAAEVFLTGALRGVEPAVIGGLPRGGPVADRLAATLAAGIPVGLAA